MFVLLRKGKKYLRNIKRVFSHLLPKVHRNNRHHTRHRRQALDIYLLDVPRLKNHGHGLLY